MNGIPLEKQNQQMDRRRHRRHKAGASPLFYQGPWYNRKTIKGHVNNWSQTGLCFETEHGNGLSRDGHVEMEAHFPKSRITSNVAGEIVRNKILSTGGHLYGIRFEKTLSEYESGRKERFKKFLISVFVVVVTVALALVKMEHIRWFWYSPLFRLYTLATAAFVVTRFIISNFYREPGDAGYLPSVSVIVAVKNEEAHISETVAHCFKSKYSKDRLEVLVIDDGSTDGTWDVLQQLTKQYPMLRLIKFAENKGKRHAMAAGAEKAKGEILVYVDSDSLIDPDGIYKIVQPFADPTVGAVAGHTKVIVESDNVISKMEAVRYFVSHQLFKASESIFGAVTCCPGAFSAYRRDVVMNVLEPWLNQMFMGVRATFGDDRSLTNFILRQYHVLYHAGAVCVTYVPRTWSQFFRQQLRWKKSWVRETTVAARIMYTKHPVAAISYYLGILLTIFSPIVFLRALIYSPALYGTPVLPYLSGVLFVYLALGVFYFLHTQRWHWYCGVLFAFMYMVVLCWQTYYAMFTVNKTHWGTR